MKKTSYKIYFFCFSAIFFITLLTIAIFNFEVDPYYVWHKKHSWKNNNVLTMYMRFSKSLQVIERNPNILLLGSSRVYHVFDPKTIEIPHNQIIYNMGISSLHAYEAYEFLKYVLRHTKVKTVIYGVDFFGFGVQQTEQGFDPDIEKLSVVFKNFGKALISWQALNNSITLTRRKPSIITTNKWQWSGYEITPKRTKQQIDNGIKRMTINDYGKFTSFGKSFHYYKEIIELCMKNNTKLIVFIPAINSRQLGAIKKAGKWKKFLKWKEELQKISKENNIVLWDFANYNSITTYPFKTAKEIKNNPYFLDTSHASPLVGNFVMTKLGFKTKNNKPPSDFGIRLSP